MVIVRVNDRGPFHENRIIDLSYAAASRIGMLGKGTRWSRSARSIPSARRTPPTRLAGLRHRAAQPRRRHRRWPGHNPRIFLQAGHSVTAATPTAARALETGFRAAVRVVPATPPQAPCTAYRSGLWPLSRSPTRSRTGCTASASPNPLVVID